jgi:transposase-like protein
VKKRKQHSAAFKAKVALETIKEEKTAAQIASEYEIHPTMVHKWRREVEENLATLFEDGRKKDTPPEDSDKLTANLYRQIGQLTVELDFLKKACDKLGLRSGKDS